jgi:cytochrome oxidase Cu insertion factor (SCO1/SenC/PrrC family)
MAGGGMTGPDWARYRWSLIYARITPCEGHCASALARLTEVHLALGRNQARVQRVLLVADEDFRMTGDPELLVGYLDGERDAELVGALGLEMLEQGRIFVVDPLGNLVMSYPPEPDQARLLEDLERLLGVSRIG